MALLCRICSEIVLDANEAGRLARPIAPIGRQGGRREAGPTVHVHEGYCSECLGLASGEALRHRGEAQPVAAA